MITPFDGIINVLYSWAKAYKIAAAMAVSLVAVWNAILAELVADAWLVIGAGLLIVLDFISAMARIYYRRDKFRINRVRVLAWKMFGLMFLTSSFLAFEYMFKLKGSEGFDLLASYVFEFWMFYVAITEIISIANNMSLLPMIWRMGTALQKGSLKAAFLHIIHGSSDPSDS